MRGLHWPKRIIVGKSIYLSTTGRSEWVYKGSNDLKFPWKIGPLKRFLKILSLVPLRAKQGDRSHRTYSTSCKHSQQGIHCKDVKRIREGRDQFKLEVKNSIELRV